MQLIYVISKTLKEGFYRSRLPRTIYYFAIKYQSRSISLRTSDYSDNDGIIPAVSSISTLCLESSQTIAGAYLVLDIYLHGEEAR